MEEYNTTTGTPPLSLPILQDKIKRNPPCYATEFTTQYAAVESSIDLAEKCATSQEIDKELLMFIGQTCNFYHKAQDFSRLLVRLLTTQAATTTNLWKAPLNTLILMDNKGYLHRDHVYPCWFQILAHGQNEELNKLIANQLVKSLAALKDPKQKKEWQNLILSKHLKSKNEAFLTRLVRIIICLFLKQAWRDKPTLNAIAEFVFSDYNRLRIVAARFLLGDLKPLKKMEDIDDEDDESRREKQAELVSSIARQISGGLASHSKAGKKQNGKKLKKMKMAAEKELEKLEDKKTMTSHQGMIFEVMDMLYNPYGFCESLYRSFSRENFRGPFKLRIMLMTIASRLMGKFQIVLPGFFNFISKYLKPSTTDIARVLAATAQCVTCFTPAEELETITHLIANNFIVESSPPETIILGLNTIREICTRNIQGISADLLADLVEYQRNSHPGIKNSAAALRNLYRQKDSKMLPRRFRGKGGGEDVTTEIQQTIPGLDLLLRLKRCNMKKDKEDDSLSREIDKLPTQLILSSADFAALKRIRLKLMTAKSMGVNLIDWLNENNGWDDLRNDVFGATLKRKRANKEGPKERKISKIDHRTTYPSSLNDGDEEDKGSFDDKPNSDDKCLSAVAANAETCSDDQKDGASSEADGECDDEEFDDGEFDDGECDDGECDDEEFDDGECDDGSSVASEDSAKSTESSEYEKFLTGDALTGTKKISRGHAKVLERQNKRKKQEERHSRNLVKKDRAGITNKTAARSKPMAMLRQKRKNRKKKIISAKTKVQKLQQHIKKLKEKRGKKTQLRRK